MIPSSIQEEFFLRSRIHSIILLSQFLLLVKTFLMPLGTNFTPLLITLNLKWVRANLKKYFQKMNLTVVFLPARKLLLPRLRTSAVPDLLRTSTDRQSAVCQISL